METTVTTFTISPVSMVFIIYCIIELFSTLFVAGIIIFDDTRGYYSEQSVIKRYCKYIYASLMTEETFNFPLSLESTNRYTIFGKIFFTILWILVLGIPFIVGNILAIILLILGYIMHKLCFKPEGDELEG